MLPLQQAPTDEALTVLRTAAQRLAELERDGAEVPDSVSKAYRHAGVKAAILAETCEKCAYCESMITHVYFGDVEHILPKSRRNDLQFEYDNLTLACAICNNNKREYYDEAEPLLNPYHDDPSEHLVAAGPMLLLRQGSRRGQLTELTLALNRQQLLDRRRDRLEQIARLVDQYHREPDGALKRAIAAEIWKEADRCKEFAFVVKAYLENVSEVERPAVN